jgi:hypothetical protein
MVSTATASTVVGATASSCQAGRSNDWSLTSAWSSGADRVPGSPSSSTRSTSDAAWAPSAATSPQTVTNTLTRAQHEAPWPASTHANPEEQRDGQPRGGGNEPRRSPWAAGCVGERQDGAGPRGTARRDERRRNGDDDAHGDHLAGVDQGQRRRARSAEETDARGGALIHPAVSPAPAATSAMATYSARSTAAASRGVPPTALSSPTRRV